MLTKLTIRNFKRFNEVEIPLADPVVFVGPNNSGKTTALQALALWELGLRRWREKRGEKSTAEKRPGVAVNRKDLLMVPAPSAKLLWRDLHVRHVKKDNVKQQTNNIRIEVLVEGESHGQDWVCGLEFDFANEESLLCRPAMAAGGGRMAVPEEAGGVRIAYLPPMSGLASNETRLDGGAINVRLGEGRTAEVLRNLCHQVEQKEEDPELWTSLQGSVKDLFGVTLLAPVYNAERGEVEMKYVDGSGVELDLSSSGRGLQQSLLLLTYLALNPGCVLLLDEPDAHLEILRQREIYRVLVESARRSGSQLIMASHSEEVLNQAAGTGENSVVAFLGKPHRIPRSRATGIRRALDTVRFDQYYLAEQRGWILYLEDRTDLDVLRAFAERLEHPVAEALRTPHLVPVGNQPNRGRQHFDAVREAKPDLVGYLLVDRDAPELQSRAELREYKWELREIENYICQPETLEAFARAEGRRQASGPLFEEGTEEKFAEAMSRAVADRVPPAALKDRGDPWWRTVKASDEYLDLVFPAFYGAVGLRCPMSKGDYHRLVEFVPLERISEEITQVLNGIAEVIAAASPEGGG